MKMEEEEDDMKAMSELQSSRFSSLLASKERDFLLSPHGTQVKISDIEDKVLGIYFSANWHSPCRGFNKILVGAYEQLKASNFEIVFVSSDENLDAFDAYRASMPWLSIPFSDLATKKALDRRFNIEDIPCLVILQPHEFDGDDNKDELIDGVEMLYRFGEEAFPFTRERLDELELKVKEKFDSQTLSNLLTDDGFRRDYVLAHPASKQIRVDSLVGKTIGLFFSAQWCLPGVKFTPKLISIYHKIKQTLKDEEQTEDFEIIYVSTDKDGESFESYFNTMPWLSLPYQDTTIKTLAKHFDIKSIPCLIILGPDGKTVTKNGRNLLNLYEENAYPFTEERVNLLEKSMDEEGKILPGYENHEGHRHELSLVNGGGFFICCDCDEQGFSWAYQCLECGYEVHPKCIKSLGKPASEK